MDEILKVSEAAAELKCSKAHVYNAINGRIPGVTPLPAISMGRRKLVRRSTFEEWKRLNENSGADGKISLPEIDAVRRVEEQSHA